ncbi:hypothetical protein, partial [Marinicrinis lubricantis]
ILHVHGFSSYFNDFLAYEFDKECLKPLLLLDFLIVQQALLSPDVVLFFTGPYYDDRLQRTFAGSVLDSVNGMPLNLLCRVIHDKLPYHSYRTYHSGYSLRGNKAKVARFDPVVDAIVNLVLQKY